MVVLRGAVNGQGPGQTTLTTRQPLIPRSSLRVAHTIHQTHGCAPEKSTCWQIVDVARWGAQPLCCGRRDAFYLPASE